MNAWNEIEVPETSNYLKFDTGANRFRVVSEPIVGTEWWVDKKPKRVRPGVPVPANEIDIEQPPKTFWAFVVWNYNIEKLQVLELTQKSIMKEIALLAKDEDWGSPLEYDLVVTKEGDGMETRYSVTPKPKKDLDKAIAEAVKNTPIQLEALFDGLDPFAQLTMTPAGGRSDEINVDDIPF